MELLIWHEALGTDDEQATEEELLERLLYAYVADADASKDGDSGRRIQALQFMQALVVFTRLLGRQRPEAPAKPQTLYATLATRRFAVREVEPQIFIALGVGASELHGKDLRVAHEAVLEQIYALFCLFYGSIDQQLRKLPSEGGATSRRNGLDDGMAVLGRIATIRKRLRKISIAGELQDHDDAVRSSVAEDESHTQSDSKQEAQELEKELAVLVGKSPSRTLWRQCSQFFPKLLTVLEVKRLSMFHATDGVTYFPVDEATFLSLQSLIHSLEFELQDLLSGGVALFYKGNLLWRSIAQPLFQKLLLFLRLREVDGMDVDGNDRESSSLPGEHSLWMRAKYDDAFSPVWASKTTYAECAIVRHVAPQPRRSGRSLHKQTSSSVSTIVNESSETSTPLTAEQLQLLRGQRYRSDAPAYRNHGFLTRDGYFLPSWELAKGEASQQMPWNPTVFHHPSDPEAATRSGALLYHQNDMSLLMLTREVTTYAATVELLERIETCLEKVQLSAIAATIWQRYIAMVATSTSNRDKSAAQQPLFVYLNRENLAFKGPQLPRLVKSKEDDLQPRPASLWTHYFTSPSLELLNAAHNTLHSDPSAVEVRVKTVHDGWLVARHFKPTERELYAFFDTKVSSVADTQDALADLHETQFSNVFI